MNSAVGPKVYRGRRAVTMPVQLQNSPSIPDALVTISEHEQVLFEHYAAIYEFALANSARTMADDEDNSPTGTNIASQPLLPWATNRDKLKAAGKLSISRKPGLPPFLNSRGTFLRPILTKSQCWCVDGISKFVFPNQDNTYIRIELPTATPADLSSIEVFKKVLGNLCQYEQTSCPFQRDVEIASPIAPRTPTRPWTPRIRVNEKLHNSTGISISDLLEESAGTRSRENFDRVITSSNNCLPHGRKASDNISPSLESRQCSLHAMTDIDPQYLPATSTRTSSSLIGEHGIWNKVEPSSYTADDQDSVSSLLLSSKIDRVNQAASPLPKLNVYEDVSVKSGDPIVPTLESSPVSYMDCAIFDKVEEAHLQSMLGNETSLSRLAQSDPAKNVVTRAIGSNAWSVIPIQEGVQRRIPHTDSKTQDEQIISNVVADDEFVVRLSPRARQDHTHVSRPHTQEQRSLGRLLLSAAYVALIRPLVEYSFMLIHWFTTFLYNEGSNLVVGDAFQIPGNW